MVAGGGRLDPLLLTSAREAGLSVPDDASARLPAWHSAAAPAWSEGGPDLESWFRTAVGAQRDDTEHSRAWLAALKRVLEEQLGDDDYRAGWGCVRTTAFATLCLEICDGGQYVVGCRR